MTKKEKSNGTKPSAENDDDSRSTGRYEGAAKRGRANKRRGYYYEKRLEKLARSAGLTALRNPGSGAYPGFKGDVVLEGQLVEIKSRKSGFAFDELSMSTLSRTEVTDILLRLIQAVEEQRP
jgi:hypothetical protein